MKCATVPVWQRSLWTYWDYTYVFPHKWGMIKWINCDDIIKFMPACSTVKTNSGHMCLCYTPFRKKNQNICSQVWPRNTTINLHRHCLPLELDQQCRTEKRWSLDTMTTSNWPKIDKQTQKTKINNANFDFNISDKIKFACELANEFYLFFYHKN